MSEIRDFIVNDLKQRMARHSQCMSFVEKVISVLLAEAFSSTAYEIITVAMHGSSSLDAGEALIARLVYAIFITLYAPCMAWMLTKWGPKGFSFTAVIMQAHAKLCPVLLAWGWKDCASQLDTWAGEELWDEFVVASSLTILVVITQAVPAVHKSKAAVAAGGASDTLCARFMTAPSSLMLTLGYVWNVVATWVVGKVQEISDLDFMIQGLYTVIASVIITVVSVLLTTETTSSAVAVDAENLQSGDKKATHSFEDWTGLGHVKFSSTFTAILSFIYAWAFLNLTDDFGFGVMFGCSSYSKCSYQSNFVYAIVISAILPVCSFTLHTWKELEDQSPRLSKAISLQLNAMMLTTGWAWMNFYTTYMTAETSDVEAGHKVMLYIFSSVVIIVMHSIIAFILQRTAEGLLRIHRKQIDVMNKDKENIMSE